MLAKINGLKFGILPPDCVRKMSVIEVKTHELYDKDGYPIEGGIMDPHLGVVEKGRKCKTCGNAVDRCQGHFGHLELVRPVVHAGYYRKVEQLVFSTCKGCGRILLTGEELAAAKKIKELEIRIKYILAKSATKKACPYCGETKLTYKLDPPTNFFIINENSEEDMKRLYATEIREWFEKLQDDDLAVFGYKDLRPEWFILTVLPIPPVSLHPSIVLETGTRSEDDLTFKLVDIILNNNRLRDNINAGAPQLMIEDLWNLLQHNITTYFNNNTPAVPPSKHRSGRLLKTLVQRIKGKTGIIRQNLMGKRVNFAARSTITPDIYIKPDEVGVPVAFAEELTVAEKVTDYNVEAMKELIKNTALVRYVIKRVGGRKKVIDVVKDSISTELEAGDIIERVLKNGDEVLFNRYPSLHRMSIMTHKIKIVSGKAIRMHPTTCKPYNADHDGDEMNIHVPQREEGKIEAIELLSVEKNIISPKDGSIAVIPIEDIVSGAFILTLPTTKISREDAMNYFNIAGIDKIPKPDLGDYYSGKVIFSALLPKGINLRYLSEVHKFVNADKKSNKQIKESTEVIIEDGELKQGIIDKKGLSSGSAKIIFAIQKKHGNTAVIDFYDKLTRVALDVCTRYGLTTPIDDNIMPKEFYDWKEKKMGELVDVSLDLEKKYKNRSLEKMPGKNIHDSFEAYIMKEGHSTKKEIETKIVEKFIDNIFADEPKYNSLIMVLSGSKGKTDNLTNMGGTVGQAAVREKRPSRGFTDRVLSHYKREMDSALPRGYITKSYYEGLLPHELYFMSMGARQGEVDTGVSTKISGYLYRRISHATRDLFTAEDLSVRNTDNKIIQFMYGEDGIYPQNLEGRDLIGDSFFSDYIKKK